MKIKKRTLEKIRNWFFVCSLLLVLGGGYRLYTEKDWFDITTYNIVGVDADSAGELIKRMKAISTGTTLYVLPRDKILSYSHASIVREVSEVVPSRKSVIIRPSGPNTLTIQVEELVPVMRVGTSTGITKDGIVFYSKKTLEALPLFDSTSTTVSFEENGFIFNRLSSFDGKYVESLSSFIEKVSSTLFPITTIRIDDIGDVLLQGEHGSKLFLSKNIDLDKSWSTLVSAIDTDPLKSSLRSEKEKLLYIDLRFGNKVFYKFGKSGEFSNASSTVIIDDHATEATTTIR